MLYKVQLFCLLIITGAACTNEQETETKNGSSSLPATTIGLDNLNAFQVVQATNWQIAGDVYANRHEDQNLQPTEGAGVLVNLPAKNAGENANLLTKLEHGDMDLELDFLMAKGSNSGIYLQGRYEVQLLDSWLKKELNYQDCGAVYQGIDTRNRFAGHAPLLNAAKAPGLWQHLKIRFKAPQFDESGKKISNARFEEVYLNGELVQQQVEVSSPTVSALANDEKPLGPLMLQGDHGPVAFKDIRYKAYDHEQLALKEMEFEVYEGMYEASIDTLTMLKPDQSGKTDTLSQLLGNEHSQLSVRGTMEVPREGDYLFEVKAGGPAWLFIDDKMVVYNGGTHNFGQGFYGKQYLKAGNYDFQIVYANYSRSLALSYEGPGIPWTTLTTTASARKQWQPDSMVDLVNEKPKTQRGFMMHEGEKDEYAIAVGIPGGINYAYDLKNYNLLSAWHGQFLDVSEMWVERGEPQLEKPLGAIVEFSGKPAAALLKGNNANWPDSVNADEGILKNRGYRMRKNGLPVFFYTREGVQVEDYIYPAENQSGLTREITFKAGTPVSDLYILVDSGKAIEKLPDGSYGVNNKMYYIENLKGFQGEPEIRQRDGSAELLLKANASASNKISYSIIW